MKKKYLILLCFLLPQVINAQEVEIDSLKGIYYSTPERREDPRLLIEIAEEEKSADSILKYATLALKNLDENAPDSLIIKVNRVNGVGWRYAADFDKSLEFLYKAARLGENTNHQTELGIAYVEIANTYSESGDFVNSPTYYERGIELLRKDGESVIFGLVLYNFGDDLLEKGQANLALEPITEAREIFRNHKEEIYEAYSLGNLGRIYALQGKSYEAEKYLNQAIEILEKEKDFYGIADFLKAMTEIYLEKGQDYAALEFAEKALDVSRQYGLRKEQEEIHFQLFQIYEGLGDASRALDHYKSYIAYRDSIKDVKTIEEMADLRTNFELDRKQTQVDLLNERQANQRNIMIATGVALFLILLLALGLYRRNKYIGRTKKIIEKEKNRSDRLLLNILPQETAMELKEKGKVKAKRFDAVTVLFTDFKNFTHYAENLPPEKLVKSVDFYFSKFDEIVDRHGLEKIKTVGDAYMCAGGVPFPVEDHARRVVAAACEMISFVKDAQKIESNKETRFEIRIGINSGPVVAGVVGSKKWAYDIWGDAVNIAARMETCSEIGKINISENTYRLIKDEFDCDHRGEISVKNKGMMKMYFVKGPKQAEQSCVA
ncbi:adenylate/guanylate cyclase domain-containing protein [Salinimicrobium sp. HB62]|uniref:adenylate/guanylate cyclase domain-containing protein n=1 Tax=Salinimicrobium sp. HB62 TaxID=3077781 RepID=UPI002D79E1DE|nr:adenylate/guanylate cyclase domain-containing protein [Salinimicrobium sp. HB62]